MSANIWYVIQSLDLLFFTESGVFISLSKDISTNSGLLAGELEPSSQYWCIEFKVKTHALYVSPGFTTTFGNAATNSTVSSFVALRLLAGSLDDSTSKALTFEFPFTVAVATKSPVSLVAPKIDTMTLNTSFPMPVSAR